MKYTSDECSICKSEIHRYGNKKHSGKCSVCTQRKNRPYQRIYNKMVSSRKGKDSSKTITYEEFLSFVSKKKCFYCGENITWVQYGEKATKYNLDRKDNKKGYDKDNLVVCCWFCNELKSNRLTFEEMKMLSGSLRKIMKSRRGGEEK